MLRSASGLNVLLLIAVVVCALSVISSQHKARKLFIELQKGKEHAQQMEVEWGQLRLEQGTWAAPARVEQIAAKQLQMQLPRNGQVQFVRIEVPPVQSSSSSSGRGNNRPDSQAEIGQKGFNGATQQP